MGEGLLNETLRGGNDERGEKKVRMICVGASMNVRV